MIPTPVTPTATYHYPNRMGRIILLSMEEIIGRNGVNAVLKLGNLSALINNYPPDDNDPGFSFENVTCLTEMLERAYGPHGGRGVALRTGRACFNYGVRHYSVQMGLTETAFRLLPLSAKLPAGATAFAELFNNFTDQRVRIEHQDGKLLWHIERCPLCWERKSADPCCHLAVGLLQEALYWISGGKVFHVEETTCIAAGDPTCTIEIEETPIY